MDIFNRKRIGELAAELKGLRHVRDENNELRHMLDNAEAHLRGLLELQKTIPEGCTPGEYCKACEFAKKYYYHEWSYHTNRNTLITGIMCGKGEACKNFIQKEVSDD